MKREKINTKEIARRFNFEHRTVLRVLRDIVSKNKVASSMFTQLEYKSEQNKPLTMYEMGVEGFCLIAERRSYSNGDSANVKASILNEFGVEFSVVGSGHSRLECEYFSMLKKVFNKEDIVREFYISGYRTDFYFPEYDIHVEYDEEGHFSKVVRERDIEKERVIRKFYYDNYDDFTHIIRVKKGEEYESLSVIMGCICLASYNSKDCTKYYEDWEESNGSKNNIDYVNKMF